MGTEHFNDSGVTLLSLHNNMTMELVTQNSTLPSFNCDSFKPSIYRKMTQSKFEYYYSFSRVVYAMLPFVGLLSLIFNIFNVIIWTRHQNKKLSISYYLIALAISDIGLGYTYVTKGMDLGFIKIEKYRKIIPVSVPINNVYLPYVFGMINFWITMALTIERAICVAFPTRAR